MSQIPHKSLSEQNVHVRAYQRKKLKLVRALLVGRRISQVEFVGKKGWSWKVSFESGPPVFLEPVISNYGYAGMIAFCYEKKHLMFKTMGLKDSPVQPSFKVSLKPK